MKKLTPNLIRKFKYKFNSKYLIEIASEVEDKNLKMNFKDPVSPVLIEDATDENSYYVIMPMKIGIFHRLEINFIFALKSIDIEYF